MDVIRSFDTEVPYGREVANHSADLLSELQWQWTELFRSGRCRFLIVDSWHASMRRRACMYSTAAAINSDHKSTLQGPESGPGQTSPAFIHECPATQSPTEITADWYNASFIRTMPQIDTIILLQFWWIDGPDGCSCPVLQYWTHNCSCSVHLIVCCVHCYMLLGWSSRLSMWIKLILS